MHSPIFKSSWVKRRPIKDREILFLKNCLPKISFFEGMDILRAEGHDDALLQSVLYWRSSGGCVVGHPPDREAARFLSQSVTRPLKHLPAVCVAAGTAWLRPRLSDRSSPVWSRLALQFAETLYSGEFESCGSTWCWKFLIPSRASSGVLVMPQLFSLGYGRMRPSGILGR